MNKKLLWSSLISALSICASQAMSATINVDNTSGSCVASGQVAPYNEVYCTITDAVADASAADVIEVAAGNYSEDIAVSISLDIRGANSGVNPNTCSRGAETVLDGGFHFTGNDITIDGFKCENGADSFGVGTSCAYLLASTSGHAIKNNIITGQGLSGTRGILFGYQITGTSIENNYISQWHSGIYLNPSDSNTITGNDFYDNIVGIGSSGQSNLQINDNDFSENDIEGWGIDTVGVAVEAHGNCFDGDNGVGIAHYSGASIDATANWWGASDGASGVGTGSGEVVSGVVDVSSHVTDGSVCHEFTSSL